MREDPGTSSMPRKRQGLMTDSELTLDRAHALRCEVAAEVLRCFGRLRLKVTGWSMFPAIWPGDILELERAKRYELSQGQIVVFSRDRRLFVHRIWKTVGSAIVTRGDAMPHTDPVVSDQELLGRVTCIERDGQRIQPRTRLASSERVLAGLVRSSDFAARVIGVIYSLAESKASS
jgi:hypothetical protein